MPALYFSRIFYHKLKDILHHWLLTFIEHRQYLGHLVVNMSVQFFMVDGSQLES